jgi:hypothetical protein
MLGIRGCFFTAGAGEYLVIWHWRFRRAVQSRESNGRGMELVELLPEVRSVFNLLGFGEAGCGQGWAVPVCDVWQL